MENTNQLENSFCFHSTDADGRYADVYSKDSKLETIVKLNADETHYSSSRDYPVVGESGERCLYVFNSKNFNRLIELCETYKDDIIHINSSGMNWADPKLKSLSSEI